MLQNAYFLAKIGDDTSENEQHFAEILPVERPSARRRPTGPMRRRLARKNCSLPVHVRVVRRGVPVIIRGL